MKVVLIEDERITVNDLKRTLETIDPSIEVVATLASVEEGIDYFRSAPDVDLIFSDIQLGDGLSFAIFQETAIDIPIVFCTAYDTYLYEAFQSAGIDYVLKPFTRAALQKALEKYQRLEKRFTRTATDFGSLIELLQAPQQPRKNAVIVRLRDKIIPLRTDDIAVLYVELGGTYAYTFNQEKFLLAENLDVLEADFRPQFFRANRQHLVNRSAVREAAQHFNRKLAVNLKVPFKETILVGKLKTRAFLDWLAQQ